MAHSQNTELLSHIKATACCFRLGMEAAGSANLTHLIDVLSPQLEYFSQGAISKFKEILSATYAAQVRKDFLLVADLLEYEITAILKVEAN